MSSPNDNSPKDESPYATPKTTPLQSDETVNSNPSVFDEPWMRADTQQFRLDDKPASGAQMTPHEEDPENSVWDEPGLSRELIGSTPKDAVTWLRWYRQQVDQTTTATTWGVTLIAALVSGVVAVVGAVFLQLGTASYVLATVVAAPVTEEIMKIALVVWICEKRPWLFRSASQILICGLASALVFAAIENVLYLSFGDVTPGLIAWRWSVCVLLHVTCSLIASVGVVKVWSEFQRQERMPRLADGAPWIVAAMLLHGAYNLTVTILEAGGMEF